MSFPRPTGGAGSPAPHGFVLGPDEGEPYWWLGSLTLTKVGAGASGGGLDIVDRRVPPGYAPGRTLLITAPAGFADVVTELGDPATGLTLPGPDVPMPDPARIAAVSTAHGIPNP